MTSLLEQLATNAINWDIGLHSALGTQEPQGQAPSLLSRWLNRTEVAHSSQPACHRYHHGAEPRVYLHVAGRSGNSLVDTGATYSVLTSYSRAFSEAYAILDDTGKNATKDSNEHFVSAMDKYFPTSFWCPGGVLLLYWEEFSPCL